MKQCLIIPHTLSQHSLIAQSMHLPGSGQVDAMQSSTNEGCTSIGGTRAHTDKFKNVLGADTQRPVPWCFSTNPRYRQTYKLLEQDKPKGLHYTVKELLLVNMHADGQSQATQIDAFQVIAGPDGPDRTFRQLAPMQAFWPACGILLVNQGSQTVMMCWQTWHSPSAGYTVGIAWCHTQE